MEIICVNCGKSLKENVKFCVHCGAKVQPETAKIMNEEARVCACGLPLKPGAKFCTACGKRIEAVAEIKKSENEGLCECGAINIAGAKFCTKCGKPRSQIVLGIKEEQVVEKQSSVHVAQHEPLPEPSIRAVPTARIKKNKGLRWAAIIVVVLGLGAGAYFAYDTFLGGIRKKLLIEQKITVSDKDQTVAYEDDISVTVPYGLIDKEETMSISSVKGLPDIDGVKMMDAYEVNISNVQQLDGFIEITMSYDPTEIPSGMSATEALTCMYYNEAASAWEPIPYEINESENQITVYTPHLSIFAPGVAGEAVVPGPMMKIKKVRFPAGDMLSEDQVKQTLTAYGSGGSNGTKEGLTAGWDFVNEWFGLTSNASSFVENVLEVEALKGCNEIATEVGLGFALVQAAIDFGSGKKDKAVLELTKNLGNYAIGKIFSTTAMNIAMIGVFAIDYSLNKLATTAISDRNAIYEKAYALYYSDKEKSEHINSVWWYKKLKALARKSNKPSEAGDIIQKFLNDYVTEFWQNELTVAQYQERVMSQHTATGGGGLNQQLMNDISNNQLASIVNTLDKSGVFDRIMKELRLEAMGKLYDQLCKMQTQLNIEYSIKVIVKKDQDAEEYGEISLANLPIRFIVSNAAHKDLWKGTTDKNGEMDFRCTALGYVDAGCPSSVEVEIPNPVAGEEPEVFSGELKLGSSGKTTIVEILIGTPKLEGTWKLDATCTFAKLDASLQYMDAMADLYGSGDEYRKARAETTESMKGQKAQFPDLVMDGMEYIWKVTKESGFVVITSPDFDNKNSLGGTQYRIKFNGRKQFTGTIETRSYLGDKENIMKFDVIGTRIK